MSETSGFIPPALSTPGIEAPGTSRSRSVWRAAWARFRRDRLGCISLAVVLAYVVMIALTAA
ncbi:MAG TPA: ABC transporter permease, partial [Burkholderiaceae bacterium]|nr:ABC transporter permease [Burkholderiaceae bacterium]